METKLCDFDNYGKKYINDIEFERLIYNKKMMFFLLSEVTFYVTSVVNYEYLTRFS